MLRPSLRGFKIGALALSMCLLFLPQAAAQVETAGEPATAEAGGPSGPGGFQAAFNEWFTENINKPIDDVLYFKVFKTDHAWNNGEQVGLPLIVVVLVIGGLFFTFRYGFINVRLFRHSIQVIRGKFDKPEDRGEVSHFQALTSALSATVGLGNIAGVAIAGSVGGPGAECWMWFTAFFGMSMKFTSCTFAHLYRRVHDDGRVMGGPMVYLDEGMKELSPWLAPIGKIFAVVFAVLVVLAAFGAGNMFQVNQTASLIDHTFFDGDGSVAVKIGIGLIMAILAGAVLIGGIPRIGEVTARLVPLMCLFYCGVCLTIILMNVTEVPRVFAEIITSAFNPGAMFGGFVGVLVQGMRRAAFSNEAGLGSAAIAHAAARTEEPVREGVVAMMGPFIDTIVVCSMTALTILITGAHLETGMEGVQITAVAFSQLGLFADYGLCLAVFIFAYSTMIAWGYYGERGVEYLFGLRAILPYRVLYVLTIVIGPLLSLAAVLDFGDKLLLALAFPNIIGMMIISKKVKTMTDDYLRRLKAGEMKPVR